MLTREGSMLWACVVAIVESDDATGTSHCRLQRGLFAIGDRVGGRLAAEQCELSRAWTRGGAYTTPTRQRPLWKTAVAAWGLCRPHGVVESNSRGTRSSRSRVGQPPTRPPACFGATQLHGRARMGQRGYIAILGPVSWIYQRAASLLTNLRRRGGTVIRGELKHDRRLV